MVTFHAGEKATDELGAALLADIATRRVPEDALGIWWLGQATFVIRGAGNTIYFDPFLVPNSKRIVPPPFRPEQVTNASIVLCTHDHGDHIDDGSLPKLAEASPNAPILVPGVARERVIGLGIDASRVVVPPIDTPVSYGDVTVTAIPAAHENLDYSSEAGYPYLGYIIELNGVTLYHSGDCCIYAGQAERLKAKRPDVALLPINGHDWKRVHEGCDGNMTFREAVDLAAEIGVDLAIAMHFGMFENNTEPPGSFVNHAHWYYPELRTKVMARYEGFVYLKPTHVPA